jgi:hypothetical protein
MVQVIKDPIGTKGARLSSQISIAGRLLVYLPQDDHVGVSQKIPSDQRDACAPACRSWWARTRPAGAAASSCAPTARTPATPSWPRTSPTCARPGRASRTPRCGCRRLAAAPGPEPAAARAARPGDGADADHPARFARAVRHPAGVRRRVHAAGGGAAAAVQGRAADLRPVQHRRGDRQGAGAAGRPEVGRLPDRRPDRGADHGGRQHRRLRRRAQLRRHHLQDQPGGGARHRAAAAAAQPGRDHHRRLHRHAARGPPRAGAVGVPQAAGARPREDHVRRLLAAGPGGDDAQAHPRVAGPHAVRAVPACQGKGRSAPRARSATTSCARSCARRASSTRASTAWSRRRR